MTVTFWAETSEVDTVECALQELTLCRGKHTDNPFFPADFEGLPPHRSEMGHVGEGVTKCVSEMCRKGSVEKVEWRVEGICNTSFLD